MTLSWSLELLATSFTCYQSRFPQLPTLISGGRLTPRMLPPDGGLEGNLPMVPVTVTPAPELKLYFKAASYLAILCQFNTGIDQNTILKWNNTCHRALAIQGLFCAAASWSDPGL